MIQGVLDSFIFIFSFLFVLSALVFIHEMGHYSVARFFKVSVERFSVGFGKPIFSRRAKSGTLWTIGRIPLGGYVKFTGDAGAASNPDAAQLEEIKAHMDEKHGAEAWKHCFHFKPLYQRALVVLAGPMANFILAAFIYMALAMSIGVTTSDVRVFEVKPLTPAAQAGFRVGDEFVSINGYKPKNGREVVMEISMRSGDDTSVKVMRDDSVVTLSVVPEKKIKKDDIGGKYTGGEIGVKLEELESKHEYYDPFRAAIYGGETVKRNLQLTVRYIGRIFQGKEDGKALGGILKIAAMTGKVGMDSAKSGETVTEKTKFTFLNLLLVAAALSVGLGFANLLPIPVLDGGHLLFYGYEAIMRRPLSERAQEMGFRFGFAALITLFLVLTWNDIGYVADLFGKTG